MDDVLPYPAPGTSLRAMNERRRPSSAASPPPTSPLPRSAAAAHSREEILRAGLEEFSRHGFQGARLEVIAARTSTAKRMIYYYFGNKEGLYRAVLDYAYQGIRDEEGALALEHLPPREAMRQLAELSLDYHADNIDFTRLVTMENIQEGRFIATQNALQGANNRVITVIGDILRRGEAGGVFRQGVDAVDVHLLISAFCAFRVDHRYTFSKLFGRDFGSDAVRAEHKALLVDAMFRFLAP